MLTQQMARQMMALALLIGAALGGGASAQTPTPIETPTPTPNGEFLCSAGAQDGQPCNGDFDCSSPGVCVIAQGVCNGGANDTLYCGCIASTCSPSAAACLFPTPISPTPGPTPGVCVDGPNATECCLATDNIPSGYVANCSDGAPCTATQKVCTAGTSIGLSCLNDAACGGSPCQSTGKYCSGGAIEGYSCAGDTDCDTGGFCLSAGQPTPTPTATAAPSTCTGDCDASGDVTVNELIVMVNIALNTFSLSTCPVGDKDNSGDITVNEIIIAVNYALNGCGILATPTPTPNGELLCSAGPRDGQGCNTDGDCALGGVCVIAQGVCSGGSDETLYCGCIAGTCTPSSDTVCATVGGVCAGGLNANECCDVTDDRTHGYVANCSGGVACTGTQKLCISGAQKGVSCLNDTVCAAPSICQSTGRFCNLGDFDGYSCVDDSNCLNVDGSSVGTCDGATAAAVTH